MPGFREKASMSRKRQHAVSLLPGSLPRPTATTSREIQAPGGRILIYCPVWLAIDFKILSLPNWNLVVPRMISDVRVQLQGKAVLRVGRQRVPMPKFYLALCEHFNPASFITELGCGTLSQARATAALVSSTDSILCYLRLMARHPFQRLAEKFGHQ